MGKTKPQIRKIIESFKGRLKRKMNIEAVLLFGSHAKGLATKDSDIDLVIISKDFQRYKKHRNRILKMYDIWNFEYPADFLCYTPKEFEALSKKITIAKTAKEEGILI